MPRDGSGNYTKPVNSVGPAVPLTTISSTDFNQLTTDLAGEMTDSLDRSGKGAMLAGLAAGAFAGAGKVGQIVTATNVIAATNGISANITSIALSAGNWLLFAGINSGVGGGTSTTAFNGFIAIGTVAGPILGSSITQS